MACNCEGGCTHTNTFRKMHQLIKKLEKRVKELEDDEK